MKLITRTLLASMFAAFAVGAQAADKVEAPSMDASKEASKCVAVDGKEVRTADGQAVTAKADCEKLGGKLQASADKQ